MSTRENEDNTDVKTFSSVASVHLELQHSSCITHLTILHTVYDIEIEIFKLKFLLLIYCTQILNPERKKKKKKVWLRMCTTSPIPPTRAPQDIRKSGEELHAGSVTHESHLLLSSFGRDKSIQQSLFRTTQQYIHVHRTVKFSNECSLQ